MAHTTCIRNADWVIAWDRESDGHVYLRGADVAFSEDVVIHVGGRFEGPVTREFSGYGRLVMPGLIDLHAHPATMPALKGVREDMGNPRFYMSALYDGWNRFVPEPEDKAWCARYAYAEMLRSGVTTCVDLAYPYPGWVEAAAASGLRTYIAPMYQSAQWQAEEGYRLEYVWAPDEGRAAFEAAMGLIDEAERHACGRLMGMIAPMAVDVVAPELLEESLASARLRNRPLQIHAGEAAMEFQTIVRRHGMTPIQWLAALKLLGPETIVGHGIFLDHHSWLHWYSRDDLRLLAETGTTLAHSPTPFARYGIALETLGRYRAAGVCVGIGTDTHPHNMIEEMRTAILAARLAAGSLLDVSTADVFEAATLGGARALGRHDLGRLAVGAKADLVVVDLAHPAVQPAYDPVRALIHAAAERAVRDVFVDGRRVVAEGHVLTVDTVEAAARLAEVQARILARAPMRDREHRTVDELAPRAFPVRASVPGPESKKRRPARRRS